MIEHINFTPGRADIEAWQGDEFVLPLTRLDVDVDDDGAYNPVDLTGMEATMLIARHAGTQAVIAATYVEVAPVDGVFEMMISAEDMATLDGSYVYDIELAGETIMTGSFYVHSQVLAPAPAPEPAEP